MRDPSWPQGTYISLRVITEINSHYLEDEMIVPGVTDVDWQEIKRQFVAGEISREEVDALAETALRAIDRILQESVVEPPGPAIVVQPEQTRAEVQEDIERRRDTVLAECSDKVPTYKPR